ncbi:MarR family winged helix-turn-helix transcriptional regulator [Jidongwangia harbinensis]|uniref:MarR family winged helix-turn-helix transcriptional regulator n=1 Tax=Jidongwangia harbinensis TaxID=2878561 RepID=UPI001CD9CAF9|nr:MarR family winged helix-turn-helix transcriptional regulator [Jidongwangia harbinensis]MCA2218125.1 MarR family winged helix-turn-helix transcriptional regulator [Jidongwangia harbinensis]
MTRGAEDLYEVLRHVRPLHQYSAKVAADALAEHEVTMPMRAVLERLADGPQTVPQVARSLWLPRQVVQRLADAAAELGYLRFVTNPAHRRSRLAELTDAGRRVFTEIHDRELAGLAQLADRLDPRDIAACVRVISALTAHTRDLARRPGDDHGWSTPGPRPGEEVR